MMRTVRARLTFTYAALFLVIGAVLLVFIYLMLSSALEPPNDKYKDGESGRYGRNSPTEPATKEEWEWRIDEAKEQQRNDALRLVRITSGIALAVASIGALGVGWIFAGRVLRPIREITEHAQEAGESTLDRRINLQGPNDELKELADTIDDMLSRLEKSFESQKRFAAQASHELRTPLAIMGGEADVALADAAASPGNQRMANAIRNQVNRSQRLVEGLLVLARSESSVMNRDRLDLADLAGDVLEEVLALADKSHLDIDADLQSAPVAGDQALLGSLIFNLYINAIQYNRPNGWIRVKAWQSGQSSLIQVENSGDEIPESEMDRLFHPFQRGNGLDQDVRKQGGFGLGMAIIRSVSAAHHGEIVAQPRLGGGLDITVKFPTAP